MKSQQYLDQLYEAIEQSCATVDELLAIPVDKQNPRYSEKLIGLTPEQGVRADYINPDFTAKVKALMGPILYVRESVLDLLLNSQRELQQVDKNLALQVVYGYRPGEVQQASFDRACKIVQEQGCSPDDPQLTQRAHLLGAYPPVAGHPTGGAVDLTIYDRRTENTVDMGVPINIGAGKRIYTMSPEISSEAATNRSLLKSVMTCKGSEGFAPFPAEFWHFMYGDREWAWTYGKPCALYDQLSVTQARALIADPKE